MEIRQCLTRDRVMETLSSKYSVLIVIFVTITLKNSRFL